MVLAFYTHTKVGWFAGKGFGIKSNYYYCVYQKESRIFTMVPPTDKTDMKGAYVS